MTELQRKLLEMLIWLDHFCRDHNLQYYAIGGTLLGAMRHQGFIPWDDDIDIGMPRPDYEQLKYLMKNEIFDRYLLETENSNNWEYCYPFSKLYDTTTTLVENVRTGLKRGIYIDIFPIDGIGKGDNPDIRWYSKIKRKYSLYLTRVAGIRKGRNPLKNFSIKVMQIFPQFIIDDVKLRKDISVMCQKYSLYDSKWAGNLVGNWWKKEIIPSYFFGKPVEYLFEGFKIYGVERADEYLTALYGEWRKLPPVYAQVSHHDYLKCDLNNGYLKK